jgi:hypothetical protein
VYTFCAKHPVVSMHPLRQTHADFGESEFGYRPGDLQARGRQFVGGAVDLLLRALPVGPDADPVAPVRSWLESSRNETPRLLKQKAVVGLCPRPYQGQSDLAVVVYMGSTAVMEQRDGDVVMHRAPQAEEMAVSISATSGSPTSAWGGRPRRDSNSSCYGRGRL